MNRFLQRFRRDEKGGMAVELVLVLPLMFWAIMATWVFFDAFRMKSIAAKAAYTIADQIGRETNYVTPAYLDGLYQLHQFLTTSNHPTRLRVTVVRYVYNSQTHSGQYKVVWSKTRGNIAALTSTTSIQQWLPIMPYDEIVLVVENGMAYEPMFSVGLGPMSFENVVVTRPRFNSAQLCYNSSNNGGTSTATC